MKTGSILALIGGVLIIINAVLAVAAFYSDTISSSFLLSLSAIELLSGVLVLLGTYLSLKLRTAQTGGLLIVIFSAISFIGGGGFIVGSILGIIGGAFVLSKR